jgi:hypothetical protein
MHHNISNLIMTMHLSQWQKNVVEVTTLKEQTWQILHYAASPVCLALCSLSCHPSTRMQDNLFLNCRFSVNSLLMSMIF